MTDHDTIITGLKIIVAVCALTSIYCVWEIWQDWKTSNKLGRELRKNGRF